MLLCISLATGLMFLAGDGLGMAVDLSSAGNFGALAGSGITFGGVTTTITGDIGSSPTPTITGLASLILVGENHLADSHSHRAFTMAAVPLGSLAT